MSFSLENGQNKLGRENQNTTSGLVCWGVYGQFCWGKSLFIVEFYGQFGCILTWFSLQRPQRKRKEDKTDGTCGRQRLDHTLSLSLCIYKDKNNGTWGLQRLDHTLSLSVYIYKRIIKKLSCGSLISISNIFLIIIYMF